MRFIGLLSLSLVVALVGGCYKRTTNDSQQHEHSHGEEHDHDHGEHADHGHHAPHGPNHGHLFSLDSDDIQVEWKQRQDNNVIKMFLLTSGGDPQPVSLKVDQFKVIPQLGNDLTPFVLEPENVDDEGKASVFVLDDQTLRNSIHMGNDIEIVTADRTYRGEIKAHAPRDH